MLEVRGPDPSFGDDDGSADAAVAAALTAFAAGEGSETMALDALARSRLLVPVVAVLTEELSDEVRRPDEPGSDGLRAARPSFPRHGVRRAGDRRLGDAQAGKTGQSEEAAVANQPLRGRSGGGEKSSEMAMPTLIGLDGRRAVPAFTSLDAMRIWRANARPVPAAALHVWQAAVADSCAVVIDVAGPVPLAVEGARLAALARGEPPPPPCSDPDVHEIVADVLAGQLDIAGFELQPGDSDRDLVIALTLAPQAAVRDVTAIAETAAAAVMARLGGRLRRGIAIWLGATRKRS